MSLDAYRRKRHAGKTPEPFGGKVRRKGNLFMIHKHAASHLHYDLRLELDGVLKSWAVPKGPSLDPRDKRLAIEVEDHPLEYGDFEGSIPEGEYGAGTTIIWDRGTWQPRGDPHEGLRNGHLHFELDGEKLQGEWNLIANRHVRSKKPQWLLMKVRDDAARATEESNIVEDLPNSVASGLSLEEVAAGKKPRKSRVKHTASSKTQPKKPAEPARRTSGRGLPAPGAKKTPMPHEIKVELATLAAEPPEGDDWLSEIKLDGYRMICHVARGKAKLLTRTQQDWTARFASVAAAAGELPVKQAILDGEIVVFELDGRTSFQALQNAMHEDHAERLAYVVFDLLYFDGYDLRGAALEDRKRLLQNILPKEKDANGGRIQYLEHVDGDADAFYRQCCQHELEGAICKRRTQPYRSGRGPDWLKVKCLLRQEFVIGGFTDSTSRRQPFGALLVGYHDKSGQLVYAGKVGTGWNDRTMEELAADFKPLVQAKSPFAGGSERSREATHWIRPKLVAEVAFSQWTRDGRLRHPSYQGLREDKPAAKVVREQPNGHTAEPVAQTKTTAAARPDRSQANRGDKHLLVSLELEEQLAHMRFTHPDRILYPEQGLTKLDLAAYYARVADVMLPHVADRPLSLVRCPRGRAEQCFFQKHQTGDVAGVNRVAVRESGKLVYYAAINDLSGLLALVQLGVLEMHVWGAKADDVERPDRVIFDLDPGPDVPWDAVIDAATSLRKLLAGLQLNCFVKTTGGKGLHVVVPIRSDNSWAGVKRFSKSIVEHLAAEQPERFVTVSSKARRQGKIYLDYLRNDRGATSVAPFSTRARPGASVSVPIAWRELGPNLHSDQFNVENVPQRLSRLRGDPWKDFFSTHQSLPSFTSLGLE